VLLALAVIAALLCAMSAGAARTRRARQFFLSWGTQALVFVALLFVVANFVNYIGDNPAFHSVSPP